MKKLLSAALFLVMSATAGVAATVNLGLLDGEFTYERNLSGAKTLDYFTFSVKPNVAHLSITASTATKSNSYRTEIALYGDDDKLIANSGQFSPTSTLVFNGTDVPTDSSFTLVFGAWNSVFAENLSDAVSNAFPSGDYTLTIAAVPLPAGGLLLISGLAGIAAVRRAGRQKQQND